MTKKKETKQKTSSQETTDQTKPNRSTAAPVSLFSERRIGEKVTTNQGMPLNRGCRR